jgi:hypothetical protein
MRSSPTWRAGVRFLALLFVFGSMSSSAAIQFVQANAAASGGPSLRLPLPALSLSGDTIIVALASQAPACSITDTAGNTYVVATGPTQGVGALATSSTQIAYAKNITVGPRPLEITVTCAGVEVLALEYSGLDPIAPFDVGLAASSSISTSLSCGPITTATPNELLIGWALSRGYVTAPGTGFTDRLRFDGDLVEDRLIAAPGDFFATATSDNQNWVFQVAAFRAGPAGVVTVPDAGLSTGTPFVQANAAETGGGPLLLPLRHPSQPGNTIVVALRCGADAGLAVVDNAGNAYTVAVGPTAGVGGLSPVVVEIAYAWGIDAGPIPLELTVSCPADLEAHVLEYAGLGPGDPFDQASVASSATTTILNSGPVTTTAPDEVLIGWGYSLGLAAPGSGFVARDLFNGNLVEDQVVSSVGSYSATASATDPTWVMQLATFKIASTADGGRVDGGLSDGGLSDGGVADGGGADGGVDDAGAGADAGAVGAGTLPSAGSYAVACGCGATGLPSVLAVLLVLVARRRRPTLN